MMNEHVLTVSELRKRLENMESLGYGDVGLLYMDMDSMVYPINEGVHDIWKDKDGNVTRIIIG